LDRRIRWDELSARGRVILKWVAVPVAFEHTYGQIAAWFEENRPRIIDGDEVEFELPTPVTAMHVGAWMKELRAELKRIGA